MLSNPLKHERDLMIAIFSVSAGMVGVCLTGIGLLRVVTSMRPIYTLGDDALALDAVLFVAACLAAFMALRHEESPRERRFRQAADVLFLSGLVLMTTVCALITYTIV